ncbi:hypothetical protein M0R45_021420 [Rubus argutus]|uniref:Uncharacterized protein n=1 Tax=Rubus argutus TaxID=59490 RepID=A0AAW1XD19_RUBAR
MSGRDISFSDEDLRGLEVPHNDELVVGMMGANTKLDKIFCTTGFSHSILYLSTLKRFGVQQEEVRGSQQIARDCEKAILKKARSKDPSISKVAAVM